MTSANQRGRLWMRARTTARPAYTLGQRVASQQKSSTRGAPQWSMTKVMSGESQAGLHMGAEGRQPAEVLDSGGAAVVDDEVHVRVQPGRLVDVAHVELGQRQPPPRGAPVGREIARGQAQGRVCTG